MEQHADDALERGHTECRRSLQSQSLLRPTMRSSEMDRAPAAGRRKRVPFSDVLNMKRLCAECGVLLLMVSWMLTAYSWSHASSCRASIHAAHSRQQQFVSIRAFNALHWIVDEGGLVRLASATDSGMGKLGFHVEWQGEAFCLRWLATNKLVEVVTAPGADQYVLRARRYGCDDDAQRFTLTSRGSLFNLGASSHINVREEWHLRAHGDNFPWKPLPRETRATRVTLEEMAGLAAAWERSLLSLLGTLEAAAPLSPQPPPRVVSVRPQSPSARANGTAAAARLPPAPH